MKGELEKRITTEILFTNETNSGIAVRYKLEQISSWIKEVKKEFYVILGDVANHPFEVTINRFDDCIEKWFGDE